MKLPDGRPLIVSEGVIPESFAAGGRTILWLRGDRIGNHRHWERVSSVVHAETTTERGIRAIEAASIPARQWVGGMIGKFFRRRHVAGAGRTWTLPDGTSAEQFGPRRTDLMLAWTEDDTSFIDEAVIRARWGESLEVKAIGVGLYLISGVEPTPPRAAKNPRLDSPKRDSPLQLAESALSAARESGDGRREMMTLADLGLACLREGNTLRAGELLDESLVKARQIGDRSTELVVMIDMGLVALVSGRPDRAKQILAPSLTLAQAIGDRVAEKLALDRMGEAISKSGDHAFALAHFNRALSIASELGDGQHEADLLWRVAVQHSESGRRDLADEHAQAAVDLMRRLGRPQADWYAHHLAGFRSGRVDAATPGLGPRGGAADHPGSSIDMGPVASHADPPSPRNAGPLRMALSAAGSMAKFLGSGFGTAAPEVYRGRVEACASCEYHTGLRCRVCGCFTAAKARLRHERCPVGKWRP